MFHGGLAIYTTLDPRLQQMAEESVRLDLPDTQGRFTAALASVDPATGAVQALVGGRDFDTDQVQPGHRHRRRQTGSSFKTFMLVAALEAGMSAQRHHRRHRPVRHPEPGRQPAGVEPDNVEGQGGGTA